MKHPNKEELSLYPALRLATHKERDAISLKKGTLLFSRLFPTAV